ncbi:hypothetical protein HAP93_02230 [Acidithiobacillus ferriphilus]|uniref:hypothetical protein n=1 Tax=Acidithiobacillus ferriphilus TaxID=1689834 RepID=UPI001C0615EA|nr:hypothetical protein [Acidithiobacillus ferriphilus]MBU2784592.1 hypothetical protein [Acidithiobacillus ferriphilus]
MGIDPVLYVTAALTLLLVALLRLFRGHVALFWLAALPGVILHELTHWMVAFVTLGRPGFIQLWPKKTGGGYSLGRVPIHNPTWYNAALIGFSPLLLIPLAYLVIRYGTPASVNLWNAWRIPVAALFAAECLLECVPSAMDMRIAARQLIPALVVLGLIAAVMFTHS